MTKTPLCLAALLCSVVACMLANTTTAYGVFGHDGKETLSLGGRVVRVLPDHGRMLLLVDFADESGIVRLRRDGSIDRTFGKGGFVRGVGGSDVLVQPGGGIVFISSEELGSGESRMVVTRLRADGSPDLSFGRGGVARLDLGGRYATGSALANAGSGRIWMAGTSDAHSSSGGGGGGRGEEPGPPAIVGRLTPSGRLDRTFSRDGLTNLPTEREVVDLVGGPAGSLLALTNGSPWLEAFKLRRGGILDESFGQRGSTPVGVPNPRKTISFFPIERVCVLTDGGFVVAGTLGPQGAGQSDYVAVAARYRANGKLDSSYGSNGFAKVGFPGLTLAAAFACRQNGRVVIAVDSVDAVSAGRQFGLVALRPNGRIDRRFGRAGRKLFTFGSDTWINDVVFPASNRIVAAGFYQAYHRPNKNVLIRLPLARHQVR